MQSKQVPIMLGRYLLFLATRRPHSALLAVPSETPPSQGSSLQKPPPYVGPPQPNNHQNPQQYDLSQLAPYPKSHEAQERTQTFYGQNYPQTQSSHDNNANRSSHQQNRSGQHPYADGRRDDHFYEGHRPNPQQVYHQQMLQTENLKNQSNQQFYTLPSRRAQRDAEAPRSVTPDITRGLSRGPLSAMHMLARHGQKSNNENQGNSGQFGSDGQLNLRERSLERLDARSRLLQNQQQLPVDVRNRFAGPLGLAAVGFRFFASSPVHEIGKNSPSTKDTLKHTPISPIGPSSHNEFKSSTPSGRNTPTVAERLALTSGRITPTLTSSGRNTPVQSTSGRSTPTNLVLSPTKSTMSNEELFAAIHKSKKRLNIRDDGDSLSPASSVTSLTQGQAGTRHSWSPESQKVPQVPQSVQPPSATSRLDFKRLLLQQSVKTGPTRLSAAEQLKLSRQQNHQYHQQQQQYQQQSSQQTPPIKVLSPRAAWRFQTPRTDVLSSTILEDSAAEEKAMKPSPENPAPISRPNPRRQLDLCSDLPANLNKENYDNSIAMIDNNMRKQQIMSDNRLINQRPNEVQVQRYPQPVVQHTTHSEYRTPTRPSNPYQGSADNRLAGQRVNENQFLEDDVANDRTRRLLIQNTNILTGQRMAVPHVRNILMSPSKQQSLKFSQNPPSLRNQSPVSVCDSRRINNQLARAQFLAPTKNEHSTYVHKQFRARSESPQHSVTQNVARSPSAPTLETAL